MLKILAPLIIVAVLMAVPFFGIKAGMDAVFGVYIPYAAFAVFIVGFVWRILSWAKSSVPFNITTTAGQQKSLPWIKAQNLENPSNKLGLIGRMALEILVFRSLFRNTKAELTKEGNLAYGSDKTLWLFGLIFHWTFLIVIVRHLRFFSEPILPFLPMLETMDSLFQIGAPTLYLTNLGLVLGATFLFARRIIIPQMRYLSLAADYFPLFLILAIAITGMGMRYGASVMNYLGMDNLALARVDVNGVKILTMSLLSFSPVVPKNIGPLFYIHFFLVASLMIYFPMSKLMHAGGIFMSPTRNMQGNSREFRHENPWGKDMKVKVHTYQEYEDDYRKMMAGAGLPLEKPLDESSEKE